jgi:hypothetical protein
MKHLPQEALEFQKYLGQVRFPGKLPAQGRRGPTRKQEKYSALGLEEKCM